MCTPMVRYAERGLPWPKLQLRNQYYARKQLIALFRGKNIITQHFGKPRFLKSVV